MKDDGTGGEPEGLYRLLAIFDDGFVYWGPGGVKIDGKRVQLAGAEFRLLTALVQHPGQVFSAEQLAELAWHNHGNPTQVRDTMAGIRQKLDWQDDGSPIEATALGWRYRAPQGGNGVREPRRPTPTSGSGRQSIGPTIVQDD